MVGMERARDQDRIYIKIKSLKHDMIQDIQVLMWHVLIANFTMILSQVSPALLIDRILMFCGCDATTVMPSYKLTYFDVRGVAENARIIFAAAKVPYEDARLSLNFGVPGDFSTIKRPEFDDMKAKGLLDVSLGKVPLLEVDGAQIGQSKAIERFLATQFGMMGSTPVEAGQVDQLCETVRDIKDAYQKVRNIKDEAEKKTAMDKWFAEDLPNWCSLTEKSLPAGSGPFLVAGKISLADILFYTLLLAPKGFFDNTEGAKAAFQSTPKMKAAMEAVDALPQLKEYFATRKETMF